MPGSTIKMIAIIGMAVLFGRTEKQSFVISPDDRY
jgi:hypothetical protein